jgi:hypothetical protein
MDNVNVMATPLLRGVRLVVLWRACRQAGRGVLADMPVNTPLHPSQEGNRTGPCL